MTPQDRSETPPSPVPDQPLRIYRPEGEVDGIITWDGFFNRVRRPVPRSRKINLSSNPGIRRVFKALFVADLVNTDAIGVDTFLAFAFVLRQMVMNISRSWKLRPEYHDVGRYGLFAVFHGVVPAAAFAWRLIEDMGLIDWSSIGIEADEVGIHAALDVGLVAQHRNSRLGPPTYYGINVTMADLILPVADLGSAFTSEKFAAHLDTSAKHEFCCTPVGFRRLARGGRGDEYPLYKLVRREQARYHFAA